MVLGFHFLRVLLTNATLHLVKLPLHEGLNVPNNYFRQLKWKKKSVQDP